MSVDPIIQIVQGLNKEFELNLTLVDFDDKGPVELLQIVNVVCAHLDETLKADVRDEPLPVRAGKLGFFLKTLKYPPCAGEQRADLEQGLAKGDRQTCYPVLHWLLENLPRHRKKAYLARFLYPVDVPSECLQDESLAEVHQHYKALCAEFMAAHKAVEKARGASVGRPEAIRRETATLADEKAQLERNIAKFEARTAGDPDFPAHLAANTGLRKEQDEEARLRESMRRQHAALQHAEARRADALRRLEDLRAADADGASPEALLARLEREAARLRQRVEEELPGDLARARERATRAAGASGEPPRTAEDVEELRRAVAADEAAVARLRERVDAAARRRDDGRLATFRATQLMVSKRLADRETERERLEEALSARRLEVEALEREAADLAGPCGAGAMTREEFKRFGARLREKTHQYKRLKAELAALCAESVALDRTEQLLRGRVGDLDAFLEQLERRRGVRGYRDTRAALDAAATATATSDRDKAQTLEEISGVVKEISRRLQDKKAELSPQIKRLRDVRAEYQRVEADYLSRKRAYDQVAVGLDVERQALERECDAYQEEALQEESRFHYLNCLHAMAEATLARVADEDARRAGRGRGLLPNFRAYEDLYGHKLAQQQAFVDQLRKQKAALEAREGPSLAQRARHGRLENVLRAKLAAREDAAPGLAPTEYDLGNARVAQF